MTELRSSNMTNQVFYVDSNCTTLNTRVIRFETPPPRPPSSVFPSPPNCDGVNADTMAVSSPCALPHVYIYADEGTSRPSITSWHKSLLQIKYPIEKVHITHATTLATNLTRQAPQQTLLLIPGGRDTPYITRLRPYIPLIWRLITCGAAYIGICAGAYLASSFCFFTPLQTRLWVCGRRLSLYPYPAFGPLQPRFAYSELSASAEALICEGEDAPQEQTRRFMTSAYANGSPAWCEPLRDSKACDSTRVLARYADIRHCHTPVAAVRHVVKKGVVVLCGVHPEFSQTDNEKFGNTHRLALLRLIMTAARACPADE